MTIYQFELIKAAINEKANEYSAKHWELRQLGVREDDPSLSRLHERMVELNECLRPLRKLYEEQVDKEV